MATTLIEPVARISASPDVLARIRDDDCNLAIWERSAPAEIASLLHDRLKDVRFLVSLAALETTLRERMSDAGFADTDVRERLIDDIGALAERFAAIMSLEELEVRLEVVTTDSCRKFHADYVDARLITTYVGTGTDWLDNQDAERVKQGEKPAQIRTLKAGDVGLFKGKMATQHPAIHRSPPIEGTGERRLLLVLNPAEAH